MYHKDHPFGKGLWVWRISKCLDGTIDSIIRKATENDISYLIIKGGDGENAWGQIPAEDVRKIHAAGLKVYSWSYNYGANPQAEAAVAIKCLGTGVDGHVFDAEAEYRDATNNALAAEVMLRAVRSMYPDKFLAHAPLAIIDYHTKFPYITFGKYCDAVMPQIYFGTMKKTPQQAILWMYDNWKRWQQNWTEAGFGDSVKPIIPLGQTYDIPDQDNPGEYVFKLQPSHIHDFARTVSGYKSVNFWSFQHIEREDCWEALRDAKVDPPTGADLGRVIVASEQTTPVETITEPPQEAVQETVPETPVAVETPVTVVEATPFVDTPNVDVAQPEVTVVEAPTEEAPTEQVVETAPPTDPVVVTPQNEPQRVELPANISIPVTKKPTTVTFKPNKEDPERYDVIVHAHKTHREYFIEFVQKLVSFVTDLLKDKRIRR